MGNAPAEELVCLRIFRQCGNRLSDGHAAAGTVADTDMVPGCVHKRTLKHGHAADILPRCLGIVFVSPVNAMGGLADVHDVLPG